MKNQLPVIKIWNMDWDFLIKNYLDPKMWEKTWTLFQYKEFVITLKLYSIRCLDMEINFQIKIEDKSQDREYFYCWGRNYDKYVTNNVSYSLKINDISFLKRKINSRILDIIIELENQHIRSQDLYKDTQDGEKREEEILREVAENFLDSEGVINEEIREAYIDSYVNNNSKLDIKLNQILEEARYQMFPDLYLAFAQSTKDDDFIEMVDKKLGKVKNLEEIRQKIEKYLEYIETEDFVEEVSDYLEEL